MNTDTTPVQRDSRQTQRGVQGIMVFIQKTSNFIRKHTKHSIRAQLSSIAMQNHFPPQSMVTQVVTAPSSQRVGHEAPNLGSVPNVDSNACEIATRRDGICSGRTLVPAVCSEGHTVACPMIYNSPGVDFFSVVNSSWKIQQYENYFKYVQYEQYAKYAEKCKICQICLTIGPHSPYLVQLRTAMNWLPCARNATSYSTVLEALDWCRHLVVLPRSCGPLRERHNLH